MDVLAKCFTAAARAKRALMSNKLIANALAEAQSRSNYADFSQHEFMLADTVRLDTYFKAIERHVTSQDVVVDLGTGTGILSFFAARKQPRHIYALDHSQMIEYAKMLARENDCHSITFVEGHSSRFRPPEPVDVIVHEQMADMLFYERMLENLIELRDRILKPGGRILPARFEFFLEPVQLHRDKRIPFIEEQRIRGISFPPPAKAPPRKQSYRYLDPWDVDYLLCDPTPVYSFDLETLTIEALPKRFATRRPITRAGELNGVCAFFNAIFDDEIMLATGPSSPRTHWGLPMVRMPTRRYEEGEEFELTVEVPRLSEHDEWSWKIGSAEFTPA